MLSRLNMHYQVCIQTFSICFHKLHLKHNTVSQWMVTITEFQFVFSALKLNWDWIDLWFHITVCFHANNFSRSSRKLLFSIAQIEKNCLCRTNWESYFFQKLGKFNKMSKSWYLCPSKNYSVRIFDCIFLCM